jgi:CRISPR-associated protein Csc1
MYYEGEQSLLLLAPLVYLVYFIVGKPMTFIYHCQLELHDYLYFATREIGRLYETEAVLHNYALCYALGFVDNPDYDTAIADPAEEYRYFCRHQVPHYRSHLGRLNEAGIYVTPAIALQHTSSLNTWKYADNRYHVEMLKTQKNIPSFGRAKEISPGSEFEFFVISQREPELKFPHWIRLGKWMSKAKLKTKCVEFEAKEREFICRLPLNPLDVISSYPIQNFDTINMPPVSLIQNVRANGAMYQLNCDDKKIDIPAKMKFAFSKN